jgi:hypothetical protein
LTTRGATVKQSGELVVTFVVVQVDVVEAGAKVEREEAEAKVEGEEAEAKVEAAEDAL